MIDFNDTAASTKNTPRIVSDAEREELRAELLARLESVLFSLFPAGKKRRGTFLIGDVLGSPGDSLEVVLDGEKAGLWTDRADDSGGDVYALIGNHFGIDVIRDFHACSMLPPICSRACALCAGTQRQEAISACR